MTTISSKEHENLNEFSGTIIQIDDERDGNIGFAFYGMSSGTAVIMAYEYTGDEDHDNGRKIIEQQVWQSVRDDNEGVCNGVIWMDNANIWE